MMHASTKKRDPASDKKSKKDMRRVFIAVHLPDPVIKTLAGIQQDLRQCGLQIRWTRPETIHLTLKFLGDVPAESIEALCDAVKTGVGDLAAFQRFVRLCAGRTGQLLNLSGLGDELGVNYKTVSSWIAILEASFIVFLLKPHYKNFNKRIVKQPKLYFFDTGLLCSLLDIQSPDQLRSHYLRGNIFETFVVAEYIKQRFHAGARSNAFFWRNNTGHEVDMLIEEGDAFRAVEIKSGETIAPDLFKGLDFFRKISGLSPDNCFLIYGGTKKYARDFGRVIGWRDMARIFS